MSKSSVKSDSCTLFSAIIMETFFNPSSVAIVGATEKSGSLPGIILKNILDIGYRGRIYPVNPKYKTVFGLPCFPSLL
ncbi:MAG: CoA-binding protein, partial [Planctomycetota bacterium]